MGPVEEAVPAEKIAEAPAISTKTPASTAKTVKVAVATPPAANLDEAEASKEANKKAMAADEEELFKALERLAKRRESALHKPTPAEQEQEKVFSESDEYRRSEGETVHCLRRIHALDSETVHVVTAQGMKIGRTAPADIVVSEPSVSREHCVVELAADKVRVMDLNSTNGTYIDNKRIGRAEILPVGSVLRVGNVSFEHEIRSRSEMDLKEDMTGVNRDAGSHEPRIARSS